MYYLQKSRSNDTMSRESNWKDGEHQESMSLQGQEGLPYDESYPSDSGNHECRYDRGAIPGILDAALF